MNQLSRQKKIFELVTKHGECSVELLAKQCKISEITIRRDLLSLAEAGKIIRTHGGAAIAERITFEFNFQDRSLTNHKAKTAIADKAVSMIGDVKSLLLGAGTTTLEIAKKIKDKKGLTVITTSLPIASELQFCENLQVLLIGGFLRHNSPDLTGALTEENLENLHAEMGFLGADAINFDGGIYDDSINLARMLSKMVSASEIIYAVADHTKLGKKALAKYSSLTAWQGLITDKDLPESALKQLQKAKINVLLAD